MKEMMTFEEIQQNYAGQWVLIADQEVCQDTKAIKARVIAHSLQKQEIYQYLESTKEEPLAIEYISQKAEDLAFIL